MLQRRLLVQLHYHLYIGKKNLKSLPNIAILMRKSVFVLVIIATLGVAAIITAVPYLEQVSADPDRKFKNWEREDGDQFSAGCEKADGGCKQFKEAFEGDNVNKVARESCESDSGQKCKQP
jgi:hypothetical protein